MSENASPNFTARFQGTTFDDMVEALTKGFGSFDAWRNGRDKPLDWKVGFWGDERLSLVSNQDSGGWGARTADGTPETLAIIVPRTGALDVAFGRTLAEATPGRLLMANNLEPERVSVRAAPHRSDTLSLSWAIVAQTVAAVLETPLTGALDLAPVVDRSTAAGQLIFGLAQTMIIGMRNGGPLLHSPIAISNLTQAFADLVVRLVPHRLSHLLDKKIHLIAPRHVRRAIEFMHANIAQPLTMQNVADAAGISIRALEVGFRAFKANTPSAYLRTIRLQAVREDLRDPSNRQPLRDICLKWGFFHLGRFAAIYRAAYGENPSDTRRRSDL
ncbi:AraC family transcriptional regulator protein [Rhizobium phaseoli]|uniref:AraC family transcriptional regulator n=1 Tax=Rhizobium phaseoli TaxID=396 RepID=A0A192T6I9_9HYPH|nr:MULTISPECIES: helix-turn-helix transcriptional regulator [Rhizobium]MDH6647424.1 AraC-like DNA-binding protein [Rhizobium esperanzae]ANL26308.1 AraC family transcriptional regulator protein [Rhizobium phaseoli]ANL38874.1 AraC family transcriptional regulator protein [Rhizobium phaseoli]ANL51639.1 AraC family transcriptional regulator protein [Rhizobium phaseoli]ANL57863.1 AraC family transcriptional regulator protein [Rhizobium phaseoli]